jgi:hypothetical protein
MNLHETINRNVVPPSRVAASRIKQGKEADRPRQEVVLVQRDMEKGPGEQDVPSLAKRREDLLMSLQVTPVKQVNISTSPNILVENVQHVDKKKGRHNKRSKSSMSVRQVSKISVEPVERQSRREDVPPPEEKRTRASVSEPPKNALVRHEAHQRSSLDNPKKDVPTHNGTYMEWYKKKREEREMKRRREEKEKSKVVKRKDALKKNNAANAKSVDSKIPVKRGERGRVSSRSPGREGETGRSLSEKGSPRKRWDGGGEGGSAPGTSAQRGVDDDLDSGIAMSVMVAPHTSHSLRRKNHQLLEKKSVFTIAYDDMETKQIRLNTSSPPDPII